jgi:aryl-alcohol dehydrogenase-like predicted oxidoreductase
MPRRRLGRAGLEVAELGYGARGIGGAHRVGAEDEVSLAALQEAIAPAVNSSDTALARGDGHSEGLVGGVVRASPDPVDVARKVPPADGRWGSVQTLRGHAWARPAH